MSLTPQQFYDKFEDINRNIGGNNEIIKNEFVTWAASDGINTSKNIDISIPSDLNRDNLYLLLIYNNSSETKVYTECQIKWEDIDNNIRYSNLIGVLIPQGKGISRVVKGGLLADGMRLALYNEEEIENQFNTYVQIRSL